MLVALLRIDLLPVYKKHYTHDHRIAYLNQPSILILRFLARDTYSHPKQRTQRNAIATHEQNGHLSLFEAWLDVQESSEKPRIIDWCSNKLRTVRYDDFTLYIDHNYVILPVNT